MMILEEATKDLNQGRIIQALDRIIDEAEKIGLHDYAKKAQLQKEAYFLMLTYFAKGAEDTERQELLSRIYDTAYSIIDMIKATCNNTLQKIGISDIDISAHQTLFNAIENNFPSSREDRQCIQRIILDDSNPLYLRGMVLSALTLNLMKYFDNEKYESLYTYTLEDQPLAIRARAWVAIVLVTMANDIRISTQPRLVEQLKFFCEEGKAVSRQSGEGGQDDKVSVLIAIQAALFQSLRGKDVNEIFRGKIATDLDRGLKELKRHADDEEDIAPLWEEFMQKSGIQEKIQDFLRMQKDGVDIMYDSFVHMKNITFFIEKCNWFLPFDPEYPLLKLLIRKAGAKANYVKIIAKAGNMCSTDKYSNLLMTSLIPDSQFDQVQTALQAGNINVENVLDASFEDEIIGYIHDLFRYYTLFKYDENDYNPFEHPLFLGSYLGLQNVVSNQNELNAFANLLIESKNWTDATEVMKLLVEMEESEINLLRLAHCYNKQSNDYLESLSIISKCNYLYPGNKWTIKNYAKSLDAAGDFTAEENLLREGCSAFPNDTSLIVALAQCLMNEGRYEDALEQLFKADMMKENNYSTCSNLAFCALALGNGEMAEKYVKKTLKMSKADSLDFIHGGHIALLNGNIELAIERYSKSNVEDLEYNFMAESDVLLDTGIPFDTITLALEVAKQKLNG